MVSTIRSRPTFYEILGLEPTAPGVAIARAFARESNVLRPHAFGGIAELCLAFETLRDPARRRAYDASIGLKSEWFRPPSARPVSASFMLQPAVGGPPRLAPSADPEPRPTAEPEPTPVPLNVPSVRQPYVDDKLSDGVSSINWKRTSAIVGGLVAAAVFAGALAGWWSMSSAAEPGQPGRTAMKAPAEERAPPSFAELWSEPAPRGIEAQAFRPHRAVTAVPRVQRKPERVQLAAAEAERQLIRPPQDLAEPTESDPLAPEAAATAPTVAASMPLPHRTVARTLDRIGYSCGSVSSATPVDGAAGVYRITCTSGQSFQAKPVNGRYRFRRLAGN